MFTPVLYFSNQKYCLYFSVLFYVSDQKTWIFPAVITALNFETFWGIISTFPCGIAPHGILLSTEEVGKHYNHHHVSHMTQIPDSRSSLEPPWFLNSESLRPEEHLPGLRWETPSSVCTSDKHNRTTLHVNMTSQYLLQTQLIFIYQKTASQTRALFATMLWFTPTSGDLKTAPRFIRKRQHQKKSAMFSVFIWWSTMERNPGKTPPKHHICWFQFF